MSGISMLGMLREVQILMLAALLIGGGTVKARRVIAARPVITATGATALFPLHRHRPAAAGVCAGELALGLGLLLTAGHAGAGLPALAVRVATGLLFAVAVGALQELRARGPEAGCGCFGEFSRTPVSWRVITRAAALGGAALCSIGAPPLRRPVSSGQAWLTLAAAAAELALLAALSPETGELLARLGHTDPCELRAVPVARTMSALHASAPWRHYRQFLATGPSDVWREGSWRFVVFPGVLDHRQVEVVFAVYLAGRRPPVRVGVLDAASPRSAPRTGPLQLSSQV